MCSKIFRSVAVVTLVAGLAVLGGCASSLSGRAYERGQARAVQDVRIGVVEHVREVQIEGTKSRVGAGSGALIGAAVGSKAGKEGTVARAVGVVGGAVVGGIGGAAAEEGLTRQTGLEITIKIDGGPMLAITQAADEPFYVGERVRVLTGANGVARVAHY